MNSVDTRESLSATLQYMLEYGISHESWLRWQHDYLLCAAEEEADLYEALRLSERPNRVDRNIGRIFLGERVAPSGVPYESSGEWLTFAKARRISLYKQEGA